MTGRRGYLIETRELGGEWRADALALLTAQSRSELRPGVTDCLLIELQTVARMLIDRLECRGAV